MFSLMGFFTLFTFVSSWAGSPAGTEELLLPSVGLEAFTQRRNPSWICWLTGPLDNFFFLVLHMKAFGFYSHSVSLQAWEKWTLAYNCFDGKRKTNILVSVKDEKRSWEKTKTLLFCSSANVLCSTTLIS